MSIQKQELSQNVWLISVQGRLDQELTPQLEQQLLNLNKAEHNRLIINLTETTYINSGGLRCLVSAWRQARQKEGNLVLCGLNSRLQEIFSMVGFDKVFKIYSTSELAQDAVLEM
jgi:anti-sigma B factor antagonist